MFRSQGFSGGRPLFLLLGALGLALAAPALLSAQTRRAPKPLQQRAAPKAPARPPLQGADVVAIVEGQPITRRELTYYWLQVDKRGPSMLLANLLIDRWKADKGASRRYTFTDTEIYDRLYAGQESLVADVLSSLVTSRLVEIEAKRKGIVVTRTQALARAHELFDQFRKQRNITQTDDELIEQLHLPRDIFLADMAYRVRTEKLLAADIAERNGHPINPDDWVVVRQLFVEVPPTLNADEKEKRFADARRTLETWVLEIKGGKSMEEVAREHNDDATKETDGLRGAALRGTGTKSLEDAIFALKPGELSAPLRAENGWYVFRVERRGNAIPEEERQQAWKQVVEARQPAYLLALRQKAHITSTIPLPPPETPSASATDAPADHRLMPPPPPGG